MAWKGEGRLHPSGFPGGTCSGLPLEARLCNFAAFRSRWLSIFCSSESVPLVRLINCCVMGMDGGSMLPALLSVLELRLAQLQRDLLN